MVTRNRASFLPQAIKSVQNQGFSDWELIISDDDSNDATEAVLAPLRAKDSRIKYHKNTPALGISGNRNKALSLASGKYMAVLDSDDFWLDKDKLQKQYDFLEANPDYVLIGSNIKIIDEKSNFMKETSFATEDAGIRKKILKDNQIPHSSVHLDGGAGSRVVRVGEAVVLLVVVQGHRRRQRGIHVVLVVVARPPAQREGQDARAHVDGLDIRGRDVLGQHDDLQLGTCRQRTYGQR